MGREVDRMDKMDELILDYLLNVPKVKDYNDLLDHVSSVLKANVKAELKTTWDNLSKSEEILKQDSYWQINNLMTNDYQAELQKELYLQGINPITIENEFLKLIEKSDELRKLVMILGNTSIQDDRKCVNIFDDFGWFREPGPTCDSLVWCGIMFIEPWVTRKGKHYRVYHFRRWPFDSYNILNKVLLSYLPRDFTDTDWVILFHLLLVKDRYIPQETLYAVPDSTKAEISERLTFLRNHGLIFEQQNQVTLAKGMYNPLLGYFKDNVYEGLMHGKILSLEKTISERIANLDSFVIAKRFIGLPNAYDIKHDIQGCKEIPKSSIPALDKEQLPDLYKLGLAFDLGDSILIFEKMVIEVENWIKSALSSCVIFIGKDKKSEAVTVIQEIFSECKEYIKIQDPYINNTTITLIDSSPKHLNIKLLTGPIEEKSIQSVTATIEKIKASRKSKFDVKIIHYAQEEQLTPLHARFIISKDYIWQLDNDLKNIGRGKDTVISKTKVTDNGQLEHEFDQFWGAKEDSLLPDGLVKHTFEAWKSSADHRI